MGPQSGRGRQSRDRAFAFGYEPAEVTAAQEAAARDFWEHHLKLAPSDFVVAFGGTLNHSFELETVIEAARILEASRDSVRWVICGQGDRVPSYKVLASGLTSIHFMGWVRSPEMHALLHRADVGLMPYCANNNFGSSIPNKCIEYLCYGLPILSTLASGTPRRALEEAECGLFYENGKPETLVEGVRQLMESQEERSKMSQGARNYFQQHFRAEVVYGRMADHLESLARAPVVTF
jgi:glycosyltransferase involved in cell wall biosynthesis